MLIYALSRNARAKNVVLLVAGLVFYSFGSLSGLVLLVLSALVNYLFGLAIMRSKKPRLFSFFAVTLNLLFLGFYKYLDFVITTVVGSTNWEGLGLTAPLGMSFFTFKCISYIVDTCRDKVKGTTSFFKFLLYISFFPQLIAGPIERFDDFALQINSRHIDSKTTAVGLRRFLVGLGKKLIVSAAACRVTDAVFALDGAVLDFRLAWLGAVSYMLQIYFDFSGYSDMAIGAGKMLGFETVENFNYPYVSSSITDFWRRWHISLSSWFRDYVYIPLGGSRKGRTRTALNKFIVFALCGLWHGAAWTFVLWGAWHGLFAALESLGVINTRKLSTSAPGRVLNHVYTLLVVGIGFVMFRATTVAEGLEIITAMFTAFDISSAGNVALRTIATRYDVFLLIVGCVLCTPVKGLFYSENGELPKWAEICSYAFSVVLLCLSLAAAAVGGFTPFIYMQF